MSIWRDLAVWRGPTPNHGGTMLEQRGLVVHIAEGSFEGTIAWQSDPANQVSSHFVVDVDGAIAQMLDTDVTAWTQKAGNGHWLSVENAGHTPNPLTDAQVDANARLLARAHLEYGVPLVIATCPSDRGLGHHSMGFECGVDWGHSACPGPAIKAQKPAIFARAVEIVNGDDMPLTQADIDAVAAATAKAIAYRNTNVDPDQPAETTAAAIDEAADGVRELLARPALNATVLAAALRAAADKLDPPVTP
jgi:N-acetylmuramoyl-L-alanine amidase-like protein